MDKLIVGLLLALLATPALAGKTGNDLYEACSKPTHPQSMDDVAGSIACNNYVTGVIDGVRMTHAGMEQISIPSNVTGQQIQDIVLQYLKLHPEKRHEPAVYLILTAVSEAFSKQ